MFPISSIGILIFIDVCFTLPTSPERGKNIGYFFPTIGINVYSDNLINAWQEHSHPLFIHTVFNHWWRNWGHCAMEVSVGEQSERCFSFRGLEAQSQSAVSMAVLWKPGSAAHSFPEWNFHTSDGMGSKAASCYLIQADCIFATSLYSIC